MKYIAGRFVNIRGTVVRARKRINGCQGCIFNNPFTCIRMTVPETEKDACLIDNVIFTRN